MQTIVTDEMKRALEVVNSGRNVFITGKAGTGKTTLLRWLRKELENDGLGVLTAAPTGIAAINAGGVTLHKLFAIPLGFLDPMEPLNYNLPKAKAEVLRRADVLIIDEISMVRPDLLDFVDRRLRKTRLNNAPFGGMQLVMFGDLMQLPPVVTGNELAAMKIHYNGHHFFFSNALRQATFSIIELTRVFRQQDEKFVGLLNRIRDYSATSGDMLELEEIRSLKEAANFDNGSIHICGTKAQVARINKKMLGLPQKSYATKFDDGFNKASSPVPEKLDLRVGARVMMLANDYPEERYVNGSMGVIEALEDDFAMVTIDGQDEPIKVEPFTWTDIDYVVEKDDKGKETIKKVVKGSCTQLPIDLGWAITIHKSQGLTFDRITLHLDWAFAPGMLYVALSRCRTMEGIVSEKFVNRNMIMVDPDLYAFDMTRHSYGDVFDQRFYTGMRGMGEDVMNDLRRKRLQIYRP